MAETFKETLTELYTGTSTRARRFRYGLIAFDFISILMFIAAAPLPKTYQLEYIGFVFGVLILLDLLARLWISEDRRALLCRVWVIADIVVIISLLISPFVEWEIAFLRILRGLRLIHSYHLLNDLRQISSFFNRREQAVFAGVNLFVFVFFTTSLVFTFFAPASSGLAGYVDSMYFTVSTLTTTGYGDITPNTIPGKLMAIGIMVVGVSLFVQLARAIFVPTKADYECPNCGLLKHDLDAVHCKHCGGVVKIQTEGFD